MSFSEGSGGSSSPESVALGETLSFFGSVADHAAGVAPDQAERIAALAVGMARLAGLEQDECDALYFAARLRNAGVLGNAAFVRSESLSDREAMMARWDVPARGARICERIACLPKAAADIVRWQAENWDGTGYPDQLRWAGIPRAAQLLHIAATYAGSPDPDEGLSTISAASGRTFGPEPTRTFVMWFHTFGGAIEPIEPPYDALGADSGTPMEILTLLAEYVDRHNGTPGRAQRIAQRAEEVGRALGLEENDIAQIALASLLYGAGELRAAVLESAQFDALARLGIETRAAHAMRAATLIAQCPFVAHVAPLVRARGEWYDGTGAPDGLRHDEIPPAAAALAVSIAYDAIGESYRSRITEERASPISRIETASGTQFDPKIIRALAEVLKARA